MAKPQQAKPIRQNRRKHARVPVGLPVEVHVSGLAAPLIVELMDIAPGGIRFRSLTDQVAWNRGHLQVPRRGPRRMRGRRQSATRQSEGVFIVALERANRVFRDFVLSLAA